MDYQKFLDRQFVMTDAGRIDRVRDLYTTFNPHVDLQAMIDGGYMEALEEMMESILMNLDDHSPEVIAYWAKHGMVKEFHGENTPFSWTEYAAKTGYEWKANPVDAPQNNQRRWNSFVPVSAFDPANKDRKYPVIFMLHGGFNPISVIDGWGLPLEAAKREFIVIAPSIELDDVLEDILEEAKALYPIDESRVYVCGFSYGGFMSNYLGNKRPDLFAAVCPCGAPISDGYCEKAFGPEPQPPFDGKARAEQMGTYMPVMNIYGNLDGFRFPLYDAKAFNPRIMNRDELPSATKTYVDGLNHWIRVNKGQEIDLDAVMALKGREDVSPEEKNMGLPLAPECRHTVVADGITNYIADFPSEDGIVRTRLMCEMNMPHWPTPEMARQILDFCSHFSRDRKTGESIYHA